MKLTHPMLYKIKTTIKIETQSKVKGMTVVYVTSVLVTASQDQLSWMVSNPVEQIFLLI